MAVSYESCQKVLLRGNDIPHSLYQLEANVHVSGYHDMTPASRKVRVSTITNQNWDPKGFHGNIIASNRQYLAYVLESRSGYVIRIIQQATKDRTLLKKFTGHVVDLAFAHYDSNMLGAIDEGGNLFVYDFDNAKGDISKISTHCLKLYIYRGEFPDGKAHRLVWCPYVQVEDVEDDSMLIAASHDSRIEVFDLPEIAQRYASGMSLDFTKMEKGTTFISCSHSKPVTDMAFSPDGNVLATASEDGHLKFWQLNQDTAETTKCLHDYEPHDGHAVTRLMFLDNTHDANTQFWRFLVTASCNNNIIKIWCTVKWKCLQSIRFTSCTGKDPVMLLSLDRSASYMIATDTTRSVLYVLPVRQDANIGEASFTSITEYVLTQPVLSFILTGHSPLKDDSGEEEEEEDASFNPKRNVVLLQLHCIQTRSMQELVVTFEPPDLTGIPPKDDLTISDPLIPIDAQPSHELSINDTSNDIVTSDTVQYGPGQSSPAVKLLSPVSFLTPPTLLPEQAVLCSPSDFTSSSSVVPHSSTVSLPDSLLITLPSDNTTLNEGEEMIVTSPSRSFPSAYNEDAPLIEEEWPVIERQDSPPITNDSDSDDDQVKETATTLVAAVLTNALETVTKESLTSEERTLQLLNNLLSQVMLQQEQLESLRHEQEDKFEQLMTQFQSRVQSSHENVIKEVHSLLKDNNHRIEKLIKSTDLKRNDKISQTLTQAVQSNIAGRLEKSVKNETKNSIIPAVQKSMTATQEGLTKALNEQFAATNNAINTQVLQILHTEGLVQGITNTVATALPHVLQAVLKSSLLPSLERSCQQMFHQIDDTFRKGTGEYLSQLKEQEAHSRDAALIHQMNSSLQNIVSSLSSSSSPLVTIIQNCIQSELTTLIPSLQDTLKESVMIAMKDEMVTLWDERSSSQQQRQQERIVQLVERKEYEAAFNLVLSTSNLQMVMFLCGTVSPEEVFDTNSLSPLSQPVLLSLIQQITVDLSDEVELKVKYLEHSILSLDPNDTVTSIHLPTVMQLLADQLVKTEEQLRERNEGTAPLFRAMKRVRMLSEHVCRSSSYKQ